MNRDQIELEMALLYDEIDMINEKLQYEYDPEAYNQLEYDKMIKLKKYNELAVYCNDNLATIMV